MSTKNETNYIDAVKPDLHPRSQAVGKALILLRDIVNKYAFAEEDPHQTIINMPHVYRSDSATCSDTMWFDLYNREGGRFTLNEVEDLDRRPADASIDMMLGGTEDAVSVATFKTNPPNVLGYDGAPLNTNEIESVMADLRLYQAAAHAGRLANEAGPSLNAIVL